MSRRAVFIVMSLLTVWAFGCQGQKWNPSGWSFGTKASPAKPPQPVPKPIDLLLPKSIRIHPFTGTRTFDEAGGVKGLDVRIEARDGYGDSAKAFGKFRFEMYEFVPNSLDPKGSRIASWEEDLLQPKKNLLHWDKITRTYEFKLQWNRPVPTGSRFVLLTFFSSPFTERLSDERIFISGQ